MTPKVVCSTQGGLRNRIKGLVSGMRLAAKGERQRVPFWTLKKRFCNCQFSDLSDNPVHQNDVCPKKPTHRIWRLWLLPDDVPAGFSRVHPTRSGRDIDFEYGRIPLALWGEYLEYFNQLRPIRAVRQIAAERAAKMSENTVGVHIGRTDHRKHADRNTGTDDNSMAAIEALSDRDSETRFFPATDCPHTESRFTRRYRRRVLAHPKRSSDRSSAEGVQDALVDLLLLARTGRLLGSYKSTFKAGGLVADAVQSDS